ncbi:unnamed protein product [Protopolystoma xenopodis]|nr:unnamed protein product [Protopolystoma xenopodis]
MAHYACYKSLPVECDFGVLHDIMLPPSAVSLPRTSVLMEHIIGMMKPQPESISGVPALTDEFSSSGDSPEESGFERKSNRDKPDRDFDGRVDYFHLFEILFGCFLCSALCDSS